MVVPDGGDINALERGLEIKFFLITQKKGRGLVMALKFLGNTTEIHAKNSRNTILWHTWRGMVSISCWKWNSNPVTICVHFLSLFLRLKGSS